MKNEEMQIEELLCLSLSDRRMALTEEFADAVIRASRNFGVNPVLCLLPIRDATGVSVSLRIDEGAFAGEPKPEHVQCATSLSKQVADLVDGVLSTLPGIAEKQG